MRGVRLRYFLWGMILPAIKRLQRQEIKMLRPKNILAAICVICALGAVAVMAQPPERPPQGENDRDREGPPRDDEGGPRQGPPRGGRYGRPPNPLMDALDTNHDGQLSAEEIANAPASLKKLDKNGDGKLTADELRPRRPSGRSRRAGRRGPDDEGSGSGGPRGNFGPGARGGDFGPPDGGRGEPGDRPGADDGPPNQGGPGRGPGGGFSAERMVQHAMQFDVDGDGKLSRNELASFAQECARHQAREGAGRGRNFDGPAGTPSDDGPGRGPGGGFSAERMVQHAMQFDVDGDGKLSRNELASFAQECARHHAGERGGRGPGRDYDGPAGPPSDDDRPPRPE
jgi:Ca2+-binding EF-hand superfamily protein